MSKDKPTAFDTLIDRAAAAAEANVPRDNEYLGEDGLLHCTICRGRKQTVVNFLGKERTVRCVCDCHAEEERRHKERKQQEEIERRRRVCFQEAKDVISWTFANDDRHNPQLSDSMKQYAERFSEYRKNNNGLILYGDTGRGKTYLAACIANAVIDKGYRVYMTNFSQAANNVQATWDKQEYIDAICGYDLLIIDDLGVERKSEYMQEIVYNIIDARYRKGGPIIITTNLTPDELNKPADIGYARIYERLLERCLPVKVDGINRRRQKASQEWQTMRNQLGLEVKNNGR